MFKTELQILMQRLVDEDFFCISDTHFNHIGVQEWEPTRLRDMHNSGFGLYAKTEEELNFAHTEWIIKKWNSMVTDDDLVVHFGDLAWKGHQEILPRLKGTKILILGNHDKKGPNTYHHFDHVVRGLYILNGKYLSIAESPDPLMSAVIIDRGSNKYLLSHYPATEVEHRFKLGENEEIIPQERINNRITELCKIATAFKIDINVHGHTHSTSYISETYIDSSHGYDFENVSLEKINFEPTRISDVIYRTD